MITYELAKELKDAGFPQLGNMALKDAGVEAEMPGVYEPTLSELIEACGDRFSNLDRGPFGKWLAFDTDWKIKGDADYLDTPEEAVARLWLALNHDKQ